MKKIILGILVGIGALILLIALLGMFKFNVLSNIDGFDVDGNPVVICTDDAKGCPDGTIVGRTGPNCEFAECPGYTPKEDFVPTKDNPTQAEKICINYTFSNCPSSCVARCISSVCGEPDEEGNMICTSDCDGVGSCIERN